MNKSNTKKVADVELVKLATKKYKEFDQNMSKTIRFFLSQDISKGDLSRILTAATNKTVIYQWIRNVSLTPLKK